MLHPSSGDPFRHYFYFDPEVTNSPLAANSAPVASEIQTYPTPRFEAYAVSMPSHSYEGPSPVYQKLSFEHESFGSLDDYKAAIRTGGNVATPEVAAFWQMYRAYPKYLKSIERRKKRKSKK
jgi:hypothetical protein